MSTVLLPPGVYPIAVKCIPHACNTAYNVFPTNTFLLHSAFPTTHNGEKLWGRMRTHTHTHRCRWSSWNTPAGVVHRQHFISTMRGVPHSPSIQCSEIECCQFANCWVPLGDTPMSLDVRVSVHR